MNQNTQSKNIVEQLNVPGCKNDLQTVGISHPKHVQSSVDVECLIAEHQSIKPELDAFKSISKASALESAKFGQIEATSEGQAPSKEFFVCDRAAKLEPGSPLYYLCMEYFVGLIACHSFLLLGSVSSTCSLGWKKHEPVPTTLPTPTEQPSQLVLVGGIHLPPKPLDSVNTCSLSMRQMKAGSDSHFWVTSLLRCATDLWRLAALPQQLLWPHGGDPGPDCAKAKLRRSSLHRQSQQCTVGSGVLRWGRWLAGLLLLLSTTGVQMQMQR